MAMPQPEQPFGMTLEEAMRTQRAIRRLKPDPVDDALILKCIELALKAPTGSNAQNWEFVVVKDREVKGKLALDDDKLSEQIGPGKNIIPGEAMKSTMFINCTLPDNAAKEGEDPAWRWAGMTLINPKALDDAPLSDDSGFE